MTDNEFKPDLSEAYQQLQAKILSIYKLSGMTLDNIISHLAKGDVFTSLDLINRKEEMIEALIAGQETLQKALEEKNAEIERLNKEVDRLSQIVLYHDAHIADAEAEAIKEFAEDVKALFADGDEVIAEIDNLVKEMVGDAE